MTWAAGLFDPRRLASQAWVTGVASTPVSPELLEARCLALTVHQRGGTQVLAVSTQIKARESLVDAVVGAYLERLAADPRTLLAAQRSPVAPPLTRTLCTSLGLTDHGQCHGWLREGAVGEVVRARIAEVAVARGRERMLAAEAADGDARAEALTGAAVWVIAAREAVGRLPTTSMDGDWRDLSEEVSGALLDASSELADPLSDAGMQLLELAVRADPSDNRPRIAMEERRPRAASRVRGVEWQLRQDLLAALRTGRAEAADAAAYIASAVREGRLLEAWRCVAQGPCAPARDDEHVAAWASWLDGMLGLAPASPRPATHRAVWGFEGGSLDGFELIGQAWGSGPESRPLPGQHQLSGYEQRALLDSYHGGDRAVGTAEGRPFVVEDDFVGMLLGGGTADAGVRVELVIDGEPALTTGPTRRSPTIDPVILDLRPFKGQVARLRLVDEATTAWGHLLVDAITWLR